MQSRLARAVRLGAVTIGSLGLAGAGVADAASIRQGTATTSPTATSPLVAPGTSIGAPLSGSFNFQTPTTVGSCSGGFLRPTVAANPGSPVTLSTSTSPNSLRIDTCTDDNPGTDFARWELTNAPTLTATNTTAGAGTLTIPSSATFRVIWQSSGVLSPCSLVPVGPNPIVGQINNSNSSVTFSNIRVRTTAQGGLCALEMGNSNTGTTNNSVFSVTFAPLRTIPSGGGTGNLLGIFP